MVRNAFEGLKVCDFSWVVVGPLITRTLAAHGAMVVQIESNKHLGISRAVPPYKDGKPGPDTAGYFAYYNSNKLGLSLDMNHPKGPDVAREVVKWSDVVVANFAPGMMKKWGLSYHEIREIKRDIIMIELSNQGQTGPYSRMAALGIHLTANAGFSQLIGWPDRDPLSMNVAWPDMIAPQFALVTLIAALERKRETGEGQYLDVSQLEGALQFLVPPLLEYSANNRQQIRRGNSSLYKAPHDVFKCQGDDRWCAISVSSDDEWIKLCKAMGNPAWAQKKKFDTMLGRKRNEEELNCKIEEWTTSLEPEKIMVLLQNVGVSAGLVANMEDVHKDPQLRDRNHFWTVNHPVQGNITTIGEPSVFSKSPAQLKKPAPLLGEDTEYVCKSLLGMSESEFRTLSDEGVFY